MVLRKIVIVAYFLFTGFSSLGQAGTNFWFGFMENAGTVNNLHMVVFIATDRPVTGTISVAVSGYSQSFNIATDSVLEIELPVATVMHVGSEIIESMGIHVTTSDSVLVSILNAKMANSDGTLVLPFEYLAADYLVLSYYAPFSPINLALSEFLVICPLDSTILTILPSDSTLAGIAPGSPIINQLNSGESYQVQTNGGDLTGTHISANKAIAVFSGAKTTEIPSGPGLPTFGYGDHLFEQMIPVNSWGTHFVTTPLLQRDSGDTFRILALEDTTIVNIDGIDIDTLNKGVFWESIISSPSIITSSKPVCIAQYANGISFDNTTGDPFEIVLLPATNLYKKTYFKTYYNSPISNFDFLVNIITKSSSISSVFMDGTQLLASAFDTISGSDFSYASFQVTEGTHKIESDSGFVAYYYAFDQFDSFGMALTGYSDQYLTGLTPSQSEEMNLRLFPNPVDVILSISLPFTPLKESLLNVKIWDVNGREVLSKIVSNSLNITVDVSGLNSGLYFLVLSDTSNKLIGKSKFCVNRR